VIARSLLTTRVAKQLRTGDFTQATHDAFLLAIRLQRHTVFSGPAGVPASNIRFIVKVSGAWSELTGVSYKGRIVDIIFDEGGNHDGAQPGTATITAENNIAAEILRYEWKEDDADDDVTLTTIYMEGS
jgi:hypothetical protein